MAKQTAKDRPILYKPEMAQAAHDDLKTNTRRIVKTGTEWGTPADLDDLSEYGLSQMRHCCPYGKIGDLLWVKEVHYAFGQWQPDGVTKKGNIKWRFSDLTDNKRPVLFPNNPPEIINTKKSDFGYFKRNSLFMPKKHVRTWTRITDIRVERLQDITEAGSKAEGIRLIEHSKWTGQDYYGVTEQEAAGARTAFMFLWDSINGKSRKKDGPDISWKSNPWVWVIEFERIERC